MKNFRSRKEIIDTVNLVFTPLMCLSRGGADYKNDHIMHFGNENYNNDGKIESQDFSLECPSYILDDGDPVLVETFYMAKDIINKLDNGYLVMDSKTNKPRKATYKDFAILIDNSKHFDEIVKIFNYFNIPLEVIKNDNLAENIISSGDYQ